MVEKNIVKLLIGLISRRLRWENFVVVVVNTVYVRT